MSRIIRNLYSSFKKKYTYLSVPDDGQLNKKKHRTYDLKFTNSNKNN